MILRESHEKMNRIDGAQLSDPDKVVNVFIGLVNSENPAVDLFLGSDTFTPAKARLEQLNDQMDDWKPVSYATDFD